MPLLLSGCYDAFVALEPLGAETSVPGDFVGAPGDSYFATTSERGGTGRYVVFVSAASNLVADDTNGRIDVFRRDRVARETVLVSVSSSGELADGSSDKAEVSADGRFVVFNSFATNLAPAGLDTNADNDVFLRDFFTGTTELVSVSLAGGAGNGPSTYPDVTPDGRFVVFQSEADDLVPGDTNAASDVFVRDRVSGATARVSIASDGAQGNAASFLPRISDDGRYVSFVSRATTMVVGKTSSYFDVFVHDRAQGTTIRVSEAVGGGDPDADSYSLPVITGDGAWVVFASEARNLVAGDTNDAYDVFLWSRASGAVERASVGDGEEQADAAVYTEGLGVTSDGRYVVWSSAATNLVPGDTNAVEDVFVRDRTLATTERITVDDIQGNGASRRPNMSADGRCIVFESAATNFLPGDTNGAFDVFTVFR